MRRADLLPGQRLFVLASSSVTHLINPGDVLSERGPRIGERYWQVVHIEQARKYYHAAVQQLTREEALAAMDEGSWHFVLLSRAIPVDRSGRHRRSDEPNATPR